MHAGNRLTPEKIYPTLIEPSAIRCQFNRQSLLAPDGGRFAMVSNTVHYNTVVKQLST